MGELHCFPIGKKTPLNPPLSGGQKALPLRGRLASLSGMEPPLIREVCCRCPPDKGDPPEGGRGFCRYPPSGEYVPKKGEGVFAVVPLIRGIPPKGGGGFVCSGEPPHFPIGKKTPLDPPLSGGQKALPLRGRLASLSGRKPPPLIPPYQGGNRLSASSPLPRSSRLSMGIFC